MIDLGDRRAGVTLRFPFNTNAIAGESITVGTNGTVKVYKNGSSTTEVTTGATFSEDFDGITGVHFAIIDTSADGTFYAEGNDFQVMFQAATIDGKTVNAWIGTFSLANRAALIPTTAGRTLDVSSGGEAGIDWANIGSKTTTNALTGTTVSTSQVAASVTAGVTLATGAITAAVIATDAIDADALAADASSELVAAIVAAIADTDDVAAAIWNYLTSAATTVGSMGKLIVDNINTSLATLATQSSLTAVKTKTDQLAFGTANRVNAQVYGNEASVITATSIATDALTAAKIAADAIGASELAADAVTEIATAVGTSIAVAVWDRLTSALTTSGSIGKLLTDNLNAGTGTTLNAVKAKTDQLTFTTANRVDSQLFGTQNSAITAFSIATDAIGAAELAADAVTEIATAVRTTLGMASSNLDTQLAALQADTDNLQTRIPAALTGSGNIKADLVSVNDDINVVNLFQAALGIEKIGTVATGTVTSSAFTTNLTDAEANTWRRRTVAFISGTLKYQVRPITAYDATTKVITVDEAFSTAPTIGDQFILI